MVERVLATDDVPGFAPGERHTELLLEGNEADYVAQLAEMVLEAHAILRAPEAPQVTVAELGDRQPPVRLMGASLLAFSVLLMAGLAVGFSMLDETESGTRRAYAVTPLRFGEYVVAKLVVGSVLGVSLGLGATVVVIGLDVRGGPRILDQLLR